MMQKIDFQTSIYKNVVEEEESVIPTLIAVSSFVFVLISRNDIALYILIITVALLVLNVVRSFFVYQKLFFNTSGIMRLDDTSVFFNDIEIKYKDIKLITIKTNDYYGNRISRPKGDNRPQLSLGFDNKIMVVTGNGDSFDFQFELKSKDEYQSFKKLLWEIAKTGIFSLENAKTMVNPENYKAHQELKKYCK
jgi:hypothetical protein